MMAKVTQRTELGPLRALPTVRQARIERGMRLSLTQCAQLMLASDVAWDRDCGSGGASCVAMMQPADHREGDDLPLCLLRTSSMAQSLTLPHSGSN